MDSQFKELFKKRIDHDKFLELFEDMAKTFTGERIEELYNNRNKDTPLSFKEINQYATSFNEDLMSKSDTVRNDYIAYKGRSSQKLTKGCKKAVTTCLKEYIHALEEINSSRKSAVKVKSYPQEVA